MRNSDQPFQKLSRAFTLATLTSFATPAFAEKPSIEECGSLYQTGEASYYGEEVAIGRDKKGRRIYNDTASGESFVPTKIAAAHNDLPLGTYVRVAFSGNPKGLVLRINDRGPFAEDEKGDPRIIDLTRGAKEALGMPPTAYVRIYTCG